MNKEELMYYIQEEVDRQWQLPNRPDLKEDCVNYIWEKFEGDGDWSKDDIYVVYLLIQFLSYHCREAVSSQDIEYMAIAEKERLLTMT